MSQQVLAFDLGGESGRALLVSLTDDGLAYEEIHRFPNIPVYIKGTLHWDILRIWHEIRSTIDAHLPVISSVGVDSWAEDFGLFDRKGNLLSNPVHYRDSRTNGMMAWVFEHIPRREVFDHTGIQFMQVNTLYHIASMVKSQSPLLDVADKFLMIPDLLHHWLCGAQSCEFTNATTTQFFNPRTQTWETEILDAIGFPTHILPPVVVPGTNLGAYHDIPVIAPATHDTGSAVVAAPLTTDHAAYISSGTWSLLGIEIPQPIINDATYAANVTNEGGAGGMYRFLKNVMGLWIIQQCRVTWEQTGSPYSYAELAKLAEAEPPFQSLIDPDDDTFFLHGNMPERITAYCQRTNQPVPQTVGQFARAVYESLALKYRYAIDLLATLANRPIQRIHIIGGGAKNELLCQMTANATGREVVAGPTEATALGNAIVQLVAIGQLSGIPEARGLLANSANLVRYAPRDADRWQEEYARFCTLFGLSMI